MYPVIRLVKEVIRHRNAPRLPLTGTHVAQHICWPWDIDPWMELNNGRTLTLYDLGRVVLFERIGIVPLMRENRWGGTIAGSSFRYRKRVRAFDRYELRTRMVGWDDKFFYAEQAMWRNGECCSHGLLRMAITDRNGLVRTAQVAAALDAAPESPPLPDWIRAWIAAEAERPWPPMQAEPAAREIAA
ncbi:acyl-CoA thioesterase [Tropicimonas sediminicola]|uniref:Acyl-CoA thioesterase FadM n=1 Tax=Tropicimonas sediminicola TaxID=1031541 RepID=A0A239KXH6_9RHOB|nr:acyl-CoA thioesterase [Tropicimonas sediminicola]SNT21964.1 Acyl-CoA thioesterase FadM [Tropicimonas sediminicola]